jgi:hypothetical protein
MFNIVKRRDFMLGRNVSTKATTAGNMSWSRLSTPNGLPPISALSTD